MEDLGKSQGSLLKRTYKKFLYDESVLKTGLSGIVQPPPPSFNITWLGAQETF